MGELLHLFQFLKMATRNCIWTELFMFQSWDCTVSWAVDSHADKTSKYCIVTGYRPQTKFGRGNIFTLICDSFCSQRSVCLWVWEGVSASGSRGICLWVQGVHTPRTHTPSWTHTSRSTNGRYAFYWNAFWLHFKIKNNKNSLCCIFNNLLV